MARAIFINGPTLVTANGSELGLSDSAITVSVKTIQENVDVDAWGGTNDVQAMFSEAAVSMTLIHFDRAVLDTMVQLSMGAAAIGQLPVAGTLLGANSKFITLKLSSPTGSKPWTFPTSYINGTPLSMGLGTSKSIVTLNWRILPTFTSDPYQGGNGTQGAVLWTYS